MSAGNGGASKVRGGYGRFRLGDKKFLAHRLAWQFTHGSIPEGLCVCHHCDNPGCVNPHHLFLGTRTDNMQDAVRKGRIAHQTGEAHGMSKLTENEVLEIRGLLAEGKRSGEDIGAKFGVSRQTVFKIKTGKVWGWLK